MGVVEKTELDNSVLVFYMPVGKPVKLNEMRDYVVESLRKGVLVLDHGTMMELKQIPKLGSIEVVVEEPKPAAEQPKKPEKKVPESGTGLLRNHDIKFMGNGGEEKRRIHQRMCAYRAEKGMGSWEALVAAVGKNTK